MPAKIRVFVSSTMEDLANERAAVVEAIKRLNFEPVNAEGILPTGGTSWEVLDLEIRSCLICILIQGDRYGWIPTKGYGAGQSKSVTHLEIEIARSQKIPILPFFKKLNYGADSTSPDAMLRDKFRKEIGDWKDGLFRGEFNLASDLSDKVFQALLDVLTGSYLRTAVQARVEQTAAPLSNTPAFGPLAPSHRLANTTAPREVLFAGAGLSLSAGLPSANALAGILGRALGLDPSLTLRHSLAQLFEVAEATLGRVRILQIVGELLNPPLPVEPTPAHVAAVRRFPIILTTNYDRLFERACEMLKIPYVVRTPGGDVTEDVKGQVTIFKIDGSIDSPDTLVLNPDDAQRARSDTSFWNAVEAVLKLSRPIVIGHSMRDENSLSLMQGRNREIKGIFVAPVIDPIDGRLLLDRLNLDGVESSASDYLWSTQV
ncbi:DUF4062 domain-containing protein [Mesorhizobium sp. B2-5-4]|uniref:DUF4062 domain-containing protein n=1 Tax=Mesorhizobium sp. B2-5-4 TaxID=2589926 RepID=UPI0011290FBB|nr:DUF4062 domain-containing protein [Mesorhizobium sp. B2-5-4]TPK42242.1 DUF4062 domain-containing protein [Mesorhizobium sp. B2-5-4]